MGLTSILVCPIHVFALFLECSQAVEKWVALVRFRKAVDAHTAEMARLQGLLQAATGGEERSRLTSELEQVSSRFSLEDMEDAMHREVRTVLSTQRLLLANLRMARISTEFGCFGALGSFLIDTQKAGRLATRRASYSALPC